MWCLIVPRCYRLVVETDCVYGAAAAGALDDGFGVDVEVGCEPGCCWVLELVERVFLGWW